MNIFRPKPSPTPRGLSQFHEACQALSAPRLALLAALAFPGCADRTVGTEETSTTGSTEVDSTTSEFSSTSITVTSDTTEVSETELDSSSTVIDPSTSSTTDVTSTSISETTGTTTGELDCSGYKQSGELPLQPTKGMYAPCLEDKDCGENLFCFPFGQPPEYSFCTLLDCTADEDCAVEGLSENACDVQPKCFGRGGDKNVCFLGDCGTLTHDFCPEGMFCLNADLGPMNDSGVCASKAPGSPLVDPSGVLFTFSEATPSQRNLTESEAAELESRM